MDEIIKNGTKVLVENKWIGIIDGNDIDNSESIEDINYYVCPIEYTHEKVWSKYYKMLIPKQFVIID